MCACGMFGCVCVCVCSCMCELNHVPFGVNVILEHSKLYLC